MRADEFIEMQRQDIETHKNKAVLSEIVGAMTAALKDIPDAEIDHTKSAEECYAKMEEHAKKNQKNGSYFFGMNETMEFIRKYLGVEGGEVKQPQAPTPSKKRDKLKLEAFF